MIYIYKDRIINIQWTVMKGTSQVRENFDRALLKMFLIGPHEKYLLEATAEEGVISAEVPSGLPEGTYSVELIYVKNWQSLQRPPEIHKNQPHDCRFNDRCIMRSRKDDLFAITEYETESENIGHGEVIVRLKTSVASYGYDGLSAYEIAVMRGDFTGSEGEWMESLSNGGIKIDKELSETSKNPVENQATTNGLKSKQDKLVSGENIKTINGKSILGEGNIDIPTVTVENNFGESIDNPGSQFLITKVNESVNNIADDEDLVLVENNNQDEGETIKQLKFANKAYKPAEFSGMGRVYLRKNIVDGKNVLTQNMMNKENTRYIIQYDYDLNGGEITVPNNCTLDFQGGSFKNGKLIAQDASIHAGNEMIFTKITMTRPKGYINVMWFGAKGDRVNDDTLAFQEAFSIGSPVYIPTSSSYYILKDTVMVLNNIRCDGRILFVPSVNTDIPAFYVKGGEFLEKAGNSLIIDGINILQHETYYTATGILVERIDTKIINSFIYTFKYGIKVRTYTVKIDTCTIRSCNIDISLMAKDNYNSTNDITITNSIVSHAQWLSIDIGGQKPSIVDGWNGWNILVQGCSFDESSIRIDHSYNVAIKDCYFERSSSLDNAILINEDASKYPSHSVHIDNCSFLNFKYAIYSRVSNNGLSVTNCTFKSIKRCCIVCLLGSIGQNINIYGNIYSTTAKKFHYGIEHWSGNYNEFSFQGLTFDGWKMIDGVQHVAIHGICNMITNKYQATNVIQSANYGVSTVKSVMPIGNYYINPSKEVSCSYIKGSNVLNNTLTITNDSDFYNFNIWDNLEIILDGNHYNLIVIGTLGFMQNNTYKVADISGSLLESSSDLRVSQKRAVLNSDWVSHGLPIGVNGTPGMLMRKIDSRNYFKKQADDSWKEYNEDGSIAKKVTFVDQLNKSVLSSKANSVFVIVDDITLDSNEDIQIQPGCTLDFSRGGTLSEGSISLNSTCILPLGINVLNYISSSIKGSYKEGQIIYDSSLKKARLFNGTDWVNL